MARNEKIGAKSDGTVSGTENIFQKTTSFFNRYQQIIYGVLIGLLIVIFAIIALNRFYFEPRNQRAATQILVPIQYYTQAVQSGDTAQFNLALEGDDQSDGFLNIISSYKMTKVANTSRYYAGLCYLNMGLTDEALDYFLKFKKKENVYWYAAQMLIGDLYGQQGEDSKAIKYYSKAAKGESPYYTPIALFKLGQMYEKEGNWKNALSSYEKVENQFYKEYQSMGVERYLERAKINASK